MFRHITDAQQELFNRRKVEAMGEKQNTMEVTNNIAFVTLAETGSIDEVTAAEHTDVFSPWESSISYTQGNIRRYGENLYKCLQAHTSQAEWTPDVSPSLWKKIGDPTVEFPEWSQPIGASDAYQTGDKVSYDNKHWISTVDNNVWQPGVYGWEEV